MHGRAGCTSPSLHLQHAGRQPSGEIPAGQYEVGVAADYGSSLWFRLNDVGETNWINSSSVSALDGCVRPVTALE